MQPVDGVFDQRVETVLAIIEISGLAPGGTPFLCVGRM